MGVHGIQIEFTVNGRSYSGTFLPEVASENSWDHKETLAYLVRKAGYKNTDYDVVFPKIKLQRYQSSKIKATYQEYLEFKNKNVSK